MSREKFLDVIETGLFKATIRKEFKDRHEKYPPTSYLFPITPMPYPTDSSRLYAQFHQTTQRLNRYGELSKVAASCWTSQTEENYLMWRGYASLDDGVCIVSSVLDVIKSFWECENTVMKDYRIVCGDMVYEGARSSPMTEEEWLFYKDKYYRGEQEFRFYFDKIEDVPVEKEYVRLPFNPSKMIHHIIRSPLMTEEYVEEIKRVMRQKQCIATIHKSQINMRK